MESKNMAEHKQIKISILIPCYNQEKYIKRSIYSVLNQTYENIEVIVSDDNSDDDTFSIASSIEDPRLFCYRNTENIGRIANYRKLLYKYAVGDWIVNCDGDDFFIDPNFILDVATVIKESNYEDLVLITANRYKYSEKRKKYFPQSVGNNSVGYIDGTKYLLNFYKYDHPFFHITSVYKKEEAQKKEFYSTDIISTDVESLLKLIINKKIYHIDKCVAAWRLHDQNISRNSIKKKYFENFQMVDRVYKVGLKDSNIGKKQLTKWKKNVLLSMSASGINNLHGHNPKSFEQIYLYMSKVLQQDVRIVKLKILVRVCWKKHHKYPKLIVERCIKRKKWIPEERII